MSKYAGEFHGEQFHKPLPADYCGGLQEYSVVFTDRGLNHMSAPFQKVMNDLDRILKKVYNAHSTAILPGSGTYAMEAVARQLCTGKKTMVLRNGFFSFRWTDIFDQGNIPVSNTVIKAAPTEGTDGPFFAPLSIEKVTAQIAAEKPAVVFAPHVETSLGIQFPDDYLKKLAAAVHAVGGIFVLDGIASGTYWIDMEALGVDLYITAPQKGWSGPACAGIVVMGKRGREAVDATESTSMCLNLKKWVGVMDSYVHPNGGPGHSYLTTMPTDALRLFRDIAEETEQFGFDKAKSLFIEQGAKFRAMMKSKGFKSVAAPGFESPGVVVMYTRDATMMKKLKENGIQAAAGVPFKLGEESVVWDKGLGTFRLGLFGLDKIYDVPNTIHKFEVVIDKILGQSKSKL